jgi:hypothetical protein
VSRPSGQGTTVGASRPGGEDGFVAGAEALIFGVLIFVIGTLIVVNAWGVIDAKFATSAAAREATRAVVESAPGDDLQTRAEAVARTTLAGHDRGGSDMRVTSVGAPALARCAEIGYEVEVTVPAIAFVGSVAIGQFRVSSRHYELVDPYRSGLPVTEEERAQGVSCVF